MLDGKRNARPEPQAKPLPAGVLGLEQKCLKNSARSLMAIGADGPIRASAISASPSGASAPVRFSQGEQFGPAIWRHARLDLSADFDPIKLGVFKAKLTELEGQ